MPTKRKSTLKAKPAKERVINSFGDKISDQVGDYSRHPFFLEKNRRAQAFLEKHGFPKEFRSR